MPQRGYLWQRDWTPAVSRAFTEASQRMEAVVLLGAEIEWDERRPRVVRANIAWEKVTRPARSRFGSHPSRTPTRQRSRRLRKPRSRSWPKPSLIMSRWRNSSSITIAHKRSLPAIGHGCPGYGRPCSRRRLSLRLSPPGSTHGNSIGWPAKSTDTCSRSIPCRRRMPGAPCAIPRTRALGEAEAASCVALSPSRCRPTAARRVTMAPDKLLGVAMDSIQPAGRLGPDARVRGRRGRELAVLVREWRRPVHLSCAS